MKTILDKLVVLFFIVLTLPNLAFSQDDLSFELGCEVNRIYASLLITKEKIADAQTFMDLNRYYKSSWIKEFIEVETFITKQGKEEKLVSKDDELSQEQKDFINSADVGSEVVINIIYMPDNTLKHNDPKQFDFTFTVEPEKEAQYPGGDLALDKYLKEKVVDKISDKSFDEYELSAVKFIISEEGEIISANIFDSAYQTTKNEKIENLLLETILDMPCWSPAEYANGTNVKQEFVLTLGDHRSCMINLVKVPSE